MLRQELNERHVFFDGHQYKKLLTDNDIRAMDAQPVLGSSPNSAIPTIFTTYIDPKVIEYLFAPLKAVEVAGSERIFGDWTDNTLMFKTIEFTGEVQSYGDYNNDGAAKANANFPQRQPYLYQTFTRYGQLEIERTGRAQLDWIRQLEASSIWTLNQYQNKSYFFGVDGLKNYGLLNDPALPAAIPPSGTAPNIIWANKNALEIYNDIIALFKQLVTQSNGLVDADTPMTLAMSPQIATNLNKSVEFGLNVLWYIKENYKNMKIVTAPQMAVKDSEGVVTEFVRLKADNIQNQITEEVSTPLKLKAFPLFVQHSNYSQKKAQGTTGAIIYRPVFVARMAGV